MSALPLDGIRIFDLTRILAGPTCTQLLGDLGADVIKIERAGAGDDTRKWGPPYVADPSGQATNESAYYLSANRNKRSISLDLSKTEGQALARRLIAKSDVMTENFKVGDLAKFGLDYPVLSKEFPAPRLLLDHRLRADRAICAARGLRHAGAGVGRHHVGDRPGAGCTRKPSPTRSAWALPTS